MKCRHCGERLANTFIDLGSLPPSNFYLSATDIQEAEKSYPLRVMVCEKCWLVQTEDFFGADEIFLKNYAYFSSFSTSWLKHAKAYVEKMTDKLELDEKSMVVEVGSNDGYLLQYVQQKNIPCYGIEPTHSTANAAREKGLEIHEDFFGVEKAQELANGNEQVDLSVANNVLAHVPDINGFVRGFTILLKPEGVATFEFPHLLNLVLLNQFDTIYHEHFSYLSLIAVRKILTANGLSVFNVEKLLTHGGSLRVYAQRTDSGKRAVENAVTDIIDKEIAAGMNMPDFYVGFQNKVNMVRDGFLAFLRDAKGKGKRVVGYGAAAKGNTLMNFANVGPDLIPYVVDLNPAKKNKFMPGSKIPIVDEAQLKADRPDYVFIIPWNLCAEITEQLSYIRDWNGRFVTAVPKLEIFR
jgi:SAM-dependent methyltransferase